jgi:hypothetical protein
MIIDFAPVADAIIPALVSVAASGTFTYIFREWISTRLKAAIGHEYNEKLIVHQHDMDAALQRQKAEFEINLQKIRLEHEATLTKSTMFFDHQRTAFMDIATATSRLLTAWDSTYNGNSHTMEPVPGTNREAVEALIQRHQLFLDPEIIVSLRIMNEIYDDSLPFIDEQSGQPEYPDAIQPCNNATYLFPRIVALLQKKIGVHYDSFLVEDLALFGAITLLRRYPRHRQDSLLIDYLTNKNSTPDDLVIAAKNQKEAFLNYIAEIFNSTSAPSYTAHPYVGWLRTLNQMLSDPA